MAAPTAPLTAALAAWPDGLGSCPAARRAARTWIDDPVLASFASPGKAARAIRGQTGHAVLAALAARPEDEWATAAALAGLVDWVAPITARWARASMPRADLEAAEADLLVGCLERLRQQLPDRSPQSVVQAGWHRVHNRRRTERARAARHTPLTTAIGLPGAAPARTAFEAILAELTSAATAGRLPVSGAATLAWHAAGWTTGEVSACTGAAPPALRARRSRALRCLTAGHYGLGAVA